MRAVFSLILLAAAALAVEAPREWLVIGGVDRRGRRPFNPDAIFLRYLLDRDAAPPQAGDEVEGSRRKQAWRKAAVDDKGRIRGRYAYAYAAVQSDGEIVLARAPGAGRIYVNGSGFVADIYGMGHSGVPVPLRKGTNHLFVRGMRGGFTLTFAEIEEGLHALERDVTLPHLVAGEEAATQAAVVVANASRVANRLPSPHAQLAPLGVRKIGVDLTAPAGEQPLEFTLLDRSRKVERRAAGEVRRVTFRSRIDGSVQEYSLLPPTGDPKQAGIVLTLHGAGVDAFNQARSYSAKKDLWIVAPTNRRPFGFDWQDWGRVDAYEVLTDVLRWTGADRRRVYVTGHSMGGHGTWHLGANDPDRFVAIAPSAGWSSFDSYGGERPGGKLDDLWRGADGASDTLKLVSNLIQLPTFILHGTKDDNVPMREARLMEDALRKAGGDPEALYKSGAGHWWNGPAAGGADCVDWPGIFDLFRRSKPRTDPDALDFTTVDPGVDAEHFWVRVEQPLAYGKHSRIRAKRTDERVEIDTTNVRRFRTRLGGKRTFVLDEQTLEAPGDAWFFRADDRWTLAAPAAGEKTPERSGPFKRAFSNRFIFVYGAEDPEGLARARFDAQMWWYRANGDVEIQSDAAFSLPLGKNVILYGNASINRAFAAVVPESCPIRVEAGAITVGTAKHTGDDLGCVFVYPRRGDDGTLIGVFGHTGARGARLGYTLLPFVSGVGYPDYTVFRAAILSKGDEGVVAAGWFSPDWAMPPR